MKLTVVIPCRNEKDFIAECIEAIYNCILPVGCSLKVIVVDGMSDDGTREIIEGLKSRYNNLILKDNVLQLTPYAFNIGIHDDPQFDFLQIVGARHILSKNYLKKCVEKLLNDSTIWCVGGKIVNEYLNHKGSVIASAMGTTFGMGLGNFRTLNASGFTDTVTSPMYPSFVFEKIGYFDENLVRNQDDDFNFRITKAGGKIWFESEIQLKYYVRGDYKGLWRQFFQYGYWKVFVNKKHGEVTTLRQMVPPLFVVYLFFWLLSSLFGIFAFSSLPILLYVILAFYFATLCAKNDVKIFELAKVFPILHVSYGLGYLQGIWDFLLLKKNPSDKQKRLSR